jgi:hypothetical protein
METPRIPPQEFADSMKQEMEHYLKDVMAAVNNAADGEWIAGSEEQVRDLSAEMRRRVFEAAVQERVDAAEAAFPPSGDHARGSSHGTDGVSAEEEQRSAADVAVDDQRTGPTVSPLVACRRRE